MMVIIHQTKYTMLRILEIVNPRISCSIAILGIITMRSGTLVVSIVIALLILARRLAARVARVEQRDQKGPEAALDLKVLADPKVHKVKRASRVPQEVLQDPKVHKVKRANRVNEACKVRQEQESVIWALPWQWPRTTHCH
jgi:hypothetical protein